MYSKINFDFAAKLAADGDCNLAETQLDEAEGELRDAGERRKGATLVLAQARTFIARSCVRSR